MLFHTKEKMHFRYKQGLGLVALLSGCSENKFYSAQETPQEELSQIQDPCTQNNWYAAPEGNTRPACIGVRNRIEYKAVEEEYCIVLSYAQCTEDLHTYPLDKILWTRTYAREQATLLREANTPVSVALCGLPEITDTDYEHCLGFFVPEGYTLQEVGMQFEFYALTPQERQIINEQGFAGLETFKSLALVGQFWCETQGNCTGYLNHPPQN